MEKIKIDNLDLNIEFSAVYNPETLQIFKIAQTSFLQEHVNLIPVDFDLAIKIIEGKISITKCFADLEKFSVEIIEQRSLEKLEDILHRIPEIEYSKYDLHDIVLIIRKDKIIFELNSELGGSYKQSKIQKKVSWKENIQMNFILTDYNDPHIIYNNFNFSLFELLGKPKIFSNIEFPQKFSIYTDRIFKSYVIKNENN